MYIIKRCKECGHRVHVHQCGRQHILKNTCEHLEHLQGESIKETNYDKYFK